MKAREYGIPVSAQRLNEPSSARAGKSDFWSAAGTIFAEQNRVPRIARWHGGEPGPLALAQERLWLLEQSEGGAPYYHVPLSWHIQGELDFPALERALDFLIQRHEILRTSFPAGPGGPVQRLNDWHLKVAFVDL